MQTVQLILAKWSHFAIALGFAALCHCNQMKLLVTESRKKYNYMGLYSSFMLKLCHDVKVWIHNANNCSSYNVPGTVLNILYLLAHLILPLTLWGKYSLQSLTDEETEVWSQVTCPKCYSWLSVRGSILGNSLVVQWLGLCTFIAEVIGFAAWLKKKIEEHSKFFLLKSQIQVFFFGISLV